MKSKDEKDKKEIKKTPKKDSKKALKESIKKEILEVEDKIDSLYDELKATKDKTKRKEIKAKIKEEKYKLSRIGKKDTYLSDVHQEMRLVRWPSRGEVLKYSIACIIFVVFFALFFIGIDSLFSFIEGLLN